MRACRRVLALLVVLMWAIGTLPSTSGAERGEYASRVRTAGALACRRLERATEAPREVDRDKEALAPPALTQLGPRAMHGVAFLPAPVDVHCVRTSPLAGTPRGPPVA